MNLTRNRGIPARTQSVPTRTWDYQKKLEYARKLPHQVYLGTESMARTSEIANWCNEHVGSRYYTWIYYGGGHYAFADEDTTITFSLTWGGKYD